MTKLRYVRLRCSKCQHTEMRRVEVNEHKVPVTPPLCEAIVVPPNGQCAGPMIVY